MGLRTDSVTKTYDKGSHPALADFTMDFEPGIYGLLGPNGAGKSTLLNILTANLSADRGRVLWNGEEIHKAGQSYRSILGYMPQQQNLYDEFSGDEFLWYLASLKGLKKKVTASKINEMITAVNLEEARYRKLKGYSGGMKQRILIAQAMLNDPELLIMDEPTAGLDPNERIRITNFISRMSQGKIVIFATHVISDIEFIADKIILINHGKLLKLASPEELQNSIAGKVYEGIISKDDTESLRRSGVLISNMHYVGARVKVRIISDSQSMTDYWRQVDPELSDVYLYYER
ncbi:MAG TPA: ABC transporter ATP-binding protein [Lachnospiraceae bacterium]|nr:ABC transporter ATP-binding protein [Lachnospiraceae bacterium]